MSQGWSPTWNLDKCLLQAIADLGFTTPTPVQAACIPEALVGGDVLVKARTGSGKTAAYAIPMIQNILRRKQKNTAPAVHAIVIAPTRDLCFQARDMIDDLIKYFRNDISISITCGDVQSHQKKKVSDTPGDILITTPTWLLLHLTGGNTTPNLKSVSMIVIDEADTVLAGQIHHTKYQEMLQIHLPRCQTLMLSATLTENVIQLKNSILQNPVVIKLTEDDDLDAPAEQANTPEGADGDAAASNAGDACVEQTLKLKKGRIEQFFLKLSDNDKYLALFALLRFDWIKGKTIIFCNSIDRALKIKIYLEGFGMQAAVLNSELPENSRLHVVHQFNDDAFKILIATDESVSSADSAQRKAELEKLQPKKDGKRKKGATPPVPDASEYSMQRGIDFRNVSNIINFDLPEACDSYTHRMGRCARGYTEETSKGTAISLVDTITETKLWSQILKDQTANKLRLVQEHPLPEKHLASLRYRSDDFLRTISKKTLKRARAHALANEMLNSERLVSHLSENPADLRSLQHIGKLKVSKTSHNLSVLPSYILDSCDQEVEKPKRPVNNKRRRYEQAEDGEGEQEQPAPEGAVVADGAPPKKRARRGTSKNKSLDSLDTGTAFGKKKAIEKRLSKLELKVLDPNSAGREKKIGRKQWKQKKLNSRQRRRIETKIKEKKTRKMTKPAVTS